MYSATLAEFVSSGISPGRFDRCAVRLRAPGSHAVPREFCRDKPSPGGPRPPPDPYVSSYYLRLWGIRKRERTTFLCTCYRIKRIKILSNPRQNPAVIICRIFINHHMRINSNFEAWIIIQKWIINGVFLCYWIYLTL